MAASVRVSRHPEFYLGDGNIVLEVTGVLFRIHRYFLERDSEVFRGMFASHTGKCPDGQTDRSPLALPGVTKREMEALLGFLYHGMYPREKVEIEEWLDLLSISSPFVFDRLRALAIAKLEERYAELPVLQRITLARKFDLPQWEERAIELLCSRYAPLTLEEATVVGMEAFVVIAEKREKSSRTEIRARPRPRARICIQ